jgi:dTDP-4-amino-4,6-dideoxygalactose transaminase
MAVKSVPFYRLELTSAEINRINRTLKSGWLTSGREVQLFEGEFRDYVGAKHAIAVNSCTAALHLSLLAAGCGPGDEVITTPYTFVATTETIIQTGAKLVFVDTEADTQNIDLDQVERAITTKTRAIVPVSVAGLPVDLQRLERIRRKHRVTIIHDAAHALGAAVGDHKVGSMPDFNCFSFYSTKNLTTGEGGMITVNSKQLADRLRVLALHGLSRGAWNRYSRQGSWHYQIAALGYKYNMPDILASLGLMQLRRFDAIQNSRRKVAALYHKYLSEIDELELPLEPEGSTHAWHLYIVKLRDGGEKRRNQVIEELRDAGVGTSVHFIPLYLQPYYRKCCPYTRRDLPNSFNHYKRAITLPMFVGLREDEIKFVASAFRKIFSRGK